ncbi:hypothetical protein EP7_004183 [Isosphaeraceae bacterium EP7]
MAALDPYAPCPCGSGQKFKWCCHKVEAYADRAQKLFENGQVEAAIGALDDGLKKEPANPWLLTRKALIQLRSDQPDACKATLREVLSTNPGHLGAQLLLTRAVLETEGPVEGAAQLQLALAACPAERRGALGLLFRVAGLMLGDLHQYQAARKHLELAAALGGEVDQAIESALLNLESNPSVSPWLKNPYELSEPGPAVASSARGRFQEALNWAEQGLWSTAAALFESLSAAGTGGPESDRNAGLCRLWIADDAGAVLALRRWIATAGETDEAVDLEALCQQVAPPSSADLVERVQLTWPLRDRERLLSNLRAIGDVLEEGTTQLDPAEEDSPEVQAFALLDRPALGTVDYATLKATDIPQIVGRILVGPTQAILEANDDGELDNLTGRFTAVAGTAVPPSHPKTKVVAKLERAVLTLTWEWLPPEGIDRPTLARLTDERRRTTINDVWPEVPNPAFKGRSPLKAASAGDSVVALRAALCLFEDGPDSIDLTPLRQKLGLKAEPEISADGLDLSRLNYGRYHRVDPSRFDDTTLVDFYRKSRRLALTVAMHNAAQALVSRPAVVQSGKLAATSLYGDLASMAAEKGDLATALEWIKKGRGLEPQATKSRNAPVWDMLEVRLRARSETPETWVPDLAIVLERYQQSPEANQVILLNLIEMGIVRMLPSEDPAQGYMVDPRGLQMLLQRFGPKVTTASGQLGVSATKQEIWTPGSNQGGGGGLWTPGSGSPAAGGEKPKLIIPGR